MPASSVPDPLFEMKNSFYIGNYQSCIYEAQKLKSSTPAQKLEKDIFMYRAFIAQNKYGVVVRDISASSPKVLKCIQLLAVYLGSDAKKKEETVQAIEDHLKDLDPEDKFSPYICAVIYYLQEDYDSVLRLLHKSDHLESCALVIQALLKINRIDLAQKELNAMKEIDEDCTLTQLSQAWVNLCKVGEKVQDAYYTFQELGDKYCPTPLLLNGQGAALLAMGKYEEAEALLQEALDKDPNCPETLINMIVLSEFTGKSLEVTTRYLNQLSDSHPSHPFVKEYQAKDQEFDQLAKAYAPVAETTA